MAYSLTDIQTNIAYEIDGNASISPTSADWGLRLTPINRALFDWSETYDWKQLEKIHNGNVATAGNASYTLPNDFRRMIGFPKITYDGSTSFNFPIIDPTRNYQLNPDSDRFVNVIGNDANGNTMVINAGTIASGASVQFVYQAFPASLASTGQLTECPDPTYIIQKALYYIYKTKEDPKFQEAKVEADRIMSRMIENENTLGVGYADRRVGISSLNNFRVGRD
jgi:hypothetical protein